jgi:hypothetical protein
MARIIVTVIFGGFGLVMAFVGIKQYFMQRRLLANAERVDAVIVHSEVFSSTSSNTDRRTLRSNSTTTHRPDVKFRYRRKGGGVRERPAVPDDHRADVCVTGVGSGSAGAVSAQCGVKAYVDPALPNKAYLIASAGAGPVVFMVLGLLLPPIAWFVGKYV